LASPIAREESAGFCADRFAESREHLVENPNLRIVRQTPTRYRTLDADQEVAGLSPGAHRLFRSATALTLTG
jgi:hypothetical protein